MQASSQILPCLHCNNPTSSTSLFCCRGCEAVYRLLQAQGLSDFYEWKHSTPELRPGRPVTLSDESYEAWDDPTFRKAHEVDGTVRFFLEGIHCLGCLWLIESLPRVFPEVLDARLDLGRSIATFRISAQARLSRLAGLLRDFGYRPLPLPVGDSGESMQSESSRRELIRIAVAAVAAGNIMLFSIPLYAGATGALAALFRGLAGVMFAPVIAFSAVPFFREAWAALRKRTISIELPIALALIFGAAWSYLHLARGDDTLYFDSLSAIVFLILLSRRFLKDVQARALRMDSGIGIASDTFVSVVEESGTRTVCAESLTPGMRCWVPSDTPFPADGILQSESAEVETSLLTGESVPHHLVRGDAVYAGTRNKAEAVLVEVTAVGPESRLGKILAQVTRVAATQTELARLADRVGQAFILLVLVGTAALWLIPGLETAERWRRMLSLVIVSCPCAFAFAAPLASLLALKKLSRRGVFVKDATLLERVARARSIYLDKTGTLTTGQLEVAAWEGLREALIPVIVALESRSRHPIALALCRNLRAQSTGVLPEVVDWHEERGIGVHGKVYGTHYSLRKLVTSVSEKQELATRVGLFAENTLLASATLTDALRADSADAVGALERIGLTPLLLSGDDWPAVRFAADSVGIAREHATARCSPEQKASLVSAAPESIMVGDGANDAVALASASVGIAVHGSLSLSMDAAGIYLTRPGVSEVVGLVREARRSLRVTRANLAISTLYNMLSMGIAMSGHLSPLVAAVLMPASSISVLLVTLVGMRSPVRKGGSKW